MLYRVINAIQQVANNPVIWSVFEMEEGQPVDDSLFIGVGSFVVISSLLFKLIILAVIIVIACVLFKSKEKKKRNFSKVVDARIKDKFEQLTPIGVISCTLVLEYYVNGKFYTKEISVGTEGKDMHRGSIYRNLLINPNNPHEVYDTKRVNVITIIIAIIVGILVCALLYSMFIDVLSLIDLLEINKLM